MFEVFIMLLFCVISLSHIMLVRRVKHLERVTRWVETQANNNAINFNAVSFAIDSLPRELLTPPDEAMKADIEAANIPLKDRNEHLKSLGVSSNYCT
ncbi:hypothetical protein [Mariprofundus ferrooxydans]|uniref:hypothetical protein n=1 Tax=Mariprofundus ferrooxydans TaxID=314344 RepID=UPI000594630C|nr:hypothetical protein [Mariprofundus ferrooxydans]KON48274.1 hypothetical protein AL013_04365 [Mariprofundus ferrooxydans]